MLHYMHYHVGKSFQQQEEKQTPAKSKAKNYSEMHRDYSCVGIHHYRTDILFPNNSGLVITVRIDMVTEKKQSRGNDVYQIYRTETTGLREYQKECEIDKVEYSVMC